MPWRVMVEPLTKSQGDAIAQSIKQLIAPYGIYAHWYKGIEVYVVDYEED